jgi:hypothetical protein
VEPAPKFFRPGPFDGHKAPHPPSAARDAPAAPGGYPPLGYLLECGGSIVGGLLLVFTVVKENGETQIRCSVSSWCVAPEFRSYGGMLASQALRRREVKYVNATPAPHTWPILETQDFGRYLSGWFV